MSARKLYHSSQAIEIGRCPAATLIRDLKRFMTRAQVKTLDDSSCTGRRGGFESLVRYTAIPAVEQALFCYWRAA